MTVRAGRSCRRRRSHADGEINAIVVEAQQPRDTFSLGDGSLVAPHDAVVHRVAQLERPIRCLRVPPGYAPSGRWFGANRPGRRVDDEGRRAGGFAPWQLISPSWTPTAICASPLDCGRTISRRACASTASGCAGTSRRATTSAWSRTAWRPTAASSGSATPASPSTSSGAGRHYEDLNPAGFDARERVKVLDAEGIDVAVMYPGLGLKLGAIQDRDLAVESCKVYNDWLAEWCAQSPDRLVGVGALPLQDPKRAADEARRIARLGLKAGFARPNAYNDRPLHHRAYTPVWEALSETGLPIAFHPAGLADMPGASRARRVDGAGHAPRVDPAHRPADDVVEPHVRRRARTVPRAEGDRARVRRRVDRALDGPARRVPRELRLGDTHACH